MSTAVLAPENLRVVVKMLADVAAAKYLSGAAITLIVYDSFLLLQQEYHTIWKSRWTLPKMLYYLIRAISIPFIAIAAYDRIDFRPALSNRFCELWPSLVSAPMFVTFAASNWLFTLRLIALYKHQRALVWFMRIFYICTYVVTLTFLILTLITYYRVIGVSYNPVVKCCFSTRTISYTAAIFYTPALYEFLIFTMTAYRAHKDAVVLNSGRTGLLVVLYRDNVIAFFIMLAMRSWNIWIHLTQPISAMHQATNIYWAINSVLSTRVYLNIVWLAHQPMLPPSVAAGASVASGPSETFGGTPRIAIGLRRFTAKKKAMSSTFLSEERTFENSSPHLTPDASAGQPVS